jgi:type I restriction enzyme R subunit
MPGPEESARQQIDEALAAAGWSVQGVAKANVRAERRVAIREFPLKHGYGFADYLLYVDGKTAGVLGEKKAGTTLTGVEVQAAKYSEGLRDALPAHLRPLQFLYQSTGIETRFSNWLDPEPRALRGGSWSSVLKVARSAFRRRNAPEPRDDVHGFRLVRDRSSR